MATYASATDVCARWGKDIATLDTATVTLLNVRLADVERMIFRRFTAANPPRDLVAELAAGTTNVDDIIQVEADSVLRLARNPDGYVSETDGDYTYQLNQALSAGVLEVLPTEWWMLGFLNDGMFIISPNPVLAT